MSNTKTIARNAGWYGLETVISAVVALFTSIGIARALGPTKMGYMIYVMWIASVVSTLGGLGIPATTLKYMAEFIGKGDRATARAIFLRTLLLQIGVASAATIGILFWIWHDAHAEYRLAAMLVVLSIWPAMVNSIPAQANVATEELSMNLPASVAATLVYFLAIAATVILHWGVIGVGAAFFTMRAVDLLVRFFPTLKRILAWETGRVESVVLRKRMITYAGLSVASMVIGIIVWSRSEVVLLKYLCSDIRQVAFYSVAFSMADRLLISSSVFGSAIATTIFAQYGRDRSRISHISALSFRYLALTAIPLHFISAALAAPALLLLYGNKYRGASMVVTLAPLLCMPKAFIGPVSSLLQSAEKQRHVILATILAGVVDIGVAALLIPAYGAVGACIGSGAAQVMAMGTMWAVAIHLYKVELPWKHLAKVACVSTVAALTARSIALRLAPLWAVVCGGSASLVVLFGLFYLTRVFEPEDLVRLRVMTAMLPRRVGAVLNAIVSLLIRPEEHIAKVEKVELGS